MSTALVLHVPQAERLVGAMRERYDWSAGVGVPAHVTILFPWLESAAITDDDVAALGRIAGATDPFELTFSDIGRFEDDGVVYLDPQPDGPIRRLIATVAERWPSHPPYEGRFTDVVPHLTLSDSGEPEGLDEVRAGLPFTAHVFELTLLAERDGLWRTDRTFPFRRSLSG